MSEAFITRRGAAPHKGLPQFSYTGDYEVIDDGRGDWRIKLLTSGAFTVAALGSAKGGVDVFLVGGGGGCDAGQANVALASGGGGGYTLTRRLIMLSPDTPYEIVIGAGGAHSTASGVAGANGGDTSAFGFTASGGKGAKNKGGDGGSGGGGTSRSNQVPPYKSGSDGYDGEGVKSGTQTAGGRGQRTLPGPNGETGSTREFGETNGQLYSSGGAGDYGEAGDESGGPYNKSANPISARPNTGGGGGAWNGDGGSGIVIIRNHREGSSNG